MMLRDEKGMGEPWGSGVILFKTHRKKASFNWALNLDFTVHIMIFIRN